MSDMTTKAAIAQVKRFEQFIKAFKHLDIVASELEGAENLVHEAELRRKKVEQAIKERETALAAVERQVEEARFKFNEITDSAEGTAAGIIAEATEKVDALNQEASEKLKVTRAELATAQQATQDQAGRLEEVTAEYTQLAKKLTKAREAVRSFVTEGA